MHPMAVLMSDLHLSLTPPAARDVGLSWLEVQGGYLDQISALQTAHKNDEFPYGLPVVVAGDFFDQWKPMHSPAELLNFLMFRLPQNMFVIFGQHDLPTHRYDERHRSPLETLIRAGRVTEIQAGEELQVGESDLVLHGFPWGFPLEPMERAEGDTRIHLAVVHAYIWKPGFSYENAPVESECNQYRTRLMSYDAAVFGDNHKGFMLGKRVINCGTFLRRKTDEMEYKPMVGVLYSDGHIEPHYLDTSADVWAGVKGSKGKKDQTVDSSEYIQKLKNLGVDSLDFRIAVDHHMERVKTSDAVKECVLSAIP